MLGYRNVRKANISPGHRDLFERYGETVIQLTITSGHSPASADLNPVYNNHKNARSDAEAWLAEVGDRKANKEWRIEVAEWAVLVFVILGVIVDCLLLLKGK